MELNSKLFDTTDYEKSLKILAADFQKNYDRVSAIPSPKSNLTTDYDILKVIGKGGFGTVCLCKHKNNEEYLAFKLIIKDLIIKNKFLNQIFEEKKCASSVCFPFLLRLQVSLKDDIYIYLGFPFISGGEMFTYHRSRNRFKEDEAKFYAAQTCLAFEYLHYANVIYRDLKPENILIDAFGYIKITDFGFAKRIDNSRAYTFCGTPDYLAPEIIKSKPYGKSVDWWTFGVLLYEFVAGTLPFESKRDDDLVELFELICDAKYSFPSYFSENLKDLISNLLQIDVTKRLGVLQKGTNDIKDHKWFADIDWMSILVKKTNPYYLPNVANQADTKNFGKYSDLTLYGSDSPVIIIDNYDEEFEEF